MQDVTVVITSCGRHDLLERTLDSFLRYNTYPSASITVVEDGKGSPPVSLLEKYEAAGVDIFWISTGERVGQIKAIDFAYHFSSTPYIFHCEDDWEFFRPGFIEASKVLLEEHPQCLQVWLRDRTDTNGHPMVWAQDEAYGVMRPNYKGQWHGFSFNPGLRRREEYTMLGGGYGSLTTFNRAAPWESEIAIGRYYFSHGYWAAILPHGYVKHIGDGRHVH